jgi:16S rRNA (adenine1518-N6/adenine1519-N6)-dimethyltransferase
MSTPDRIPAEVRELPLRARTDYLLRRFGLTPRKPLGQNFLVNEGAARRLADVAAAPGLPLFEIGGGLGALSVPLAATGLPLRIVEIDANLARTLAWLLADLPHVQVLTADFLTLPAAEWPAAPAVAIGNLPYFSAGAILQRLWAEDSPFSLTIATVQREVADRLRSQPGVKAYGPLSLLAAAHVTKFEVLAQLGPGSFFPEPGVESTALALTRREGLPPGLSAFAALDAAIRAAFAERRKTLLNSLKMTQKLDKAEAEAVLREANLDGKRRGETLSLAEFIALAEALRRRSDPEHGNDEGIH